MAAEDSLLERGASCVVVGDASRVRVLYAREPLAPLEEIADLANPEARLHEGDLIAGGPGRTRGGGRSHARSAVDVPSMKQHRIEAFASEVCERIRTVMQAHVAERLYLIAEPAFLGLLRRALSPELSKRLCGSVAKSVSGWPLGDIRATLPRRL